jgi:hypothetical protein
MEKEENYIVQTSAKVSLRVVLVEVVDVPCVRNLVALDVLEIIRTRSGCLSGQVRAEPFWLKLACHFGILFF